ncbi:MAG: hypothetical protein R2795_22920 [Saprospiraceae bacterium]
MSAIQQQNHLEGSLTFNIYGEVATIPFAVDRVGATATQPTVVNRIPFPANASFPASLSGRWTKNETYNSGYGDNFMGANFSQSLVFLPDGTLSEGGSNASMSGGYYGQSQGNGTGPIDGIGWYAVGNQLYLLIQDSGQWQTAHLGKWYVENNHLLITGTNGEKLLLSR